MPFDLGVLSEHFQKKHPEYLLMRPVVHGSVLEFVLRFSEEGYVKGYLEMWKDRVVSPSRFPEEALIIETLRTEFVGKLTSSGLLTITCEQLEPRTQIADQMMINEMGWVFRFFCVALLDSAADVGSVVRADASVSGYHTLQLITSQNDPTAASEIRARFVKRSLDERTDIVDHMQEYLKTFNASLWPFLSQTGIDEWVIWHRGTNEILDRAKKFDSTCKRISIDPSIEPDRTWGQIVIDGDSYSDLLSRVIDQSRFVIDIYSNRLTLAGLALALMALLFGLAFFSTSLKWPLTISTAAFLFLGIYVPILLVKRKIGHLLVYTATELVRRIAV
jgi:hypothetical protein